MPYILKQYDVTQAQKVEDFLVNVVKLSETLAHKLLQKGRITDHKKRRLQKGQILKEGYVEVLVFKAVSKGLKPLFQTEHFAVFDKPSGLLVHPTTRSTEYTLLDEIRYHFGKEASLAHRIDAETSGLVLVAKNGYAQYIFREMFEQKYFVKKYKALVENELKEETVVDKGLEPSTGIIKLKMQTSPDGKVSSTRICPIAYNKATNQTLVEAIPYTGRQHQIRVHLASISRRIVGDPIYGLDEDFVDDFLNDQIPQAERIEVTGHLGLCYMRITWSLGFWGLSMFFVLSRGLRYRIFNFSVITFLPQLTKNAIHHSECLTQNYQCSHVLILKPSAVCQT